MFLVETVSHLFHPRRSNNHRARVLHPEAFAILSLVLIVFVSSLSAISQLSTPLGNVLGFASSITPSQVMEQTNSQRATAGLPPLTLNSKLNQAALAKGQHMYLNQYWAHTAPDGTQPWKFFKDAGYGYKVAGENLARDFSNSDEMMNAWMASPTHKANIMSSRYQEIGIAVIDGTLEGYETTLVVQLFGTPGQGSVAPTAQAKPVFKPAVIVEPAPPTDPDLTIQPVVPSESNLITVEPVAPDSMVTPRPVARTESFLPSPAVLSSALVPQGSITLPPLFSPLQITKAFFLAMIMMILGTLFYDSVVIGHRGLMRLVGHNLAHVLLFLMVAFLIISFRGGILG